MALYYTTTEDLHEFLTEKELAELTTEDGDSPDSAILTAALSRAEGMVNSRVGVRYDVPITASDSSVIQELKHASLAIARFYLYTRRVPPDHVVYAYNEAMAWLDAVSRGRAAINVIVAGESVNNLGTSAATGSADRSGLAFDDFVV